MRTAKTLISLGGCPGWSESSLGAQSLCWFCHEAAKCLVPESFVLARFAKNCLCKINKVLNMLSLLIFETKMLTACDVIKHLLFLWTCIDKVCRFAIWWNIPNYFNIGFRLLCEKRFTFSDFLMSDLLIQAILLRLESPFRFRMT